MELTVKQLKEILKDMADDAIVFARDRDCISLSQVHVVNHPTIKPIAKTGKQLVEEGDTDYKGFEKYVYYQKQNGVTFVPSIKKVYGGDDTNLSNQSKQAIIFCDCD